jgi:hypothetical protein
MSDGGSASANGGSGGSGGDAPAASAAVAQSRTGPARSADAGRVTGTGQEGVDFRIGDRVARAARSAAYERRPGHPLYRMLRAYTMDASASREDGAVATIAVPYEPLQPGPVGAVLEVLDDEPVDLDAHAVVLQQGVAPSPSDARFRAQMVYAVCSTTYAAFRQALGRQVAWGFARETSGAASGTASGETSGAASGDSLRLRVRPSGGSLANAYYDKARGELRFGVYPAGDAVRGRNVPGGTVYTCLSHDIVVHEMAHALLDGLRAHFTYPSNPDVLAFHEAFADLVAVFQRCTYADVVRAAIARVNGDLARRSFLTEIATQFGETTGLASALRSTVPDAARRYGTPGLHEPHQLGQLLVAAVFDAFVTVVRKKTRRYVRLATGGASTIADGALSDALLELLADETRQIASQFLSVCIRAIDYCPPVDVSFGEFLRAVITADYDLVPDDRWGYREAWIDGFTRFGIYPANVESLAEDALRWRPPRQRVGPLADLTFARLQFRGDPARPSGRAEQERQARALGAVVGTGEYAAEFGCAAPGDARLDGDRLDLPVIESVRTSRRVGPDGQVVFDLVAEVTQRRAVRAADGGRGFDFYGGATVILDPEGSVRYAISKSVLDTRRVAAQRRYLSEEGSRYWGAAPGQQLVPEAQLFELTHQATRA